MPLSETILIVMALLTVAVIAESLCRRLPIPYTVFLVIIGIVLAEVSPQVEVLHPISEFKLTPELVFFLFLPALVFESALNLDPRQLLKDIIPIISLAVPALLLTTAFVGLGMWWLLDFNLIIALLFGALIAATDPVAVVSLFKELGVPKRLMTLVEGESLFNDATAIVVFNIILGIALVGEFSATEIPASILEFLKVFIGGALVGVLIGFACAELMYRLCSSPNSALIMTLVSAYISFVIAEHSLHLSGVMAVLFAAITTGLHSITRLEDDTEHLIRESWEVIASIANALLFLLIGLSLDLQMLADNFASICTAVLLVLAGRALSIFTMVPLTTRIFSIPQICMPERCIMWWGGLKGGLAIAIVMAIPVELAERDMLISLTLGVVLFTLLVNASTIRPVLGYLGLDKMADSDLLDLKHGLEDVKGHAEQLIGEMKDVRLLDSDTANSITSEVCQELENDQPEVGENVVERQAYMEAARIQLEAIEHLYHLKVIDEYVYIDLRIELRQMRERLASGDTSDFQEHHIPAEGFIAKIERYALRWLREQNWAAPMVARMQRHRMAEMVQKDLAQILASERINSQLQKIYSQGSSSVRTINTCYQRKEHLAHQRLKVIARDFPQFYTQLEKRLFKGAALETAKEKGNILFKNKEIGGKAYVSLDRLIATRIDHIPAATIGDDSLPSAYLVEQVPIFRNLQSSIVERLCFITQQVDFIPNDLVIEQGQQGSSLYIIAQGEASVWRKENGEKHFIATLKKGDFFGEGALLGEGLRLASVKAETHLRLIRMTRNHVMEIAKQQPEIAEALEQAQKLREQPSRAPRNA